MKDFPQAVSSRAQRGISLLRGGSLAALGMTLIFCFILAGCASSDVSRDVAANVDQGRNNAENLVDGTSDTSISDSYQNASQTTKGALLGGTAGAVAGIFSSTIGFIPGTITGAILGASYGSYIDANTSLLDRLENRGATVVVLGDQILVVLPSTIIFEDSTPRIKPQAYSTLKLLAQYINSYTKMLVKISAYTNDSGSERFDRSLSRGQAESVAKFLLAAGIDARVLYAEGYGGSRLVVKNEPGSDTNDNYRIEVTLEKLYV